MRLQSNFISALNILLCDYSFPKKFPIQEVLVVSEIPIPMTSIEWTL